MNPITILSFRELNETDIIRLLKSIPQAEYPPELLEKRGAAFQAQMRKKQEESDGLWNGISDEQDARNSRPFPY